MNQTLLFSLVVPTVNRTTELENLLCSLCTQTIKDFEILVIDQNEDKRIHSIIDKFINKLNIIHIYHSSIGVSAAKNVGIHHATGKIIAFPDDDCEYEANVLSDVLDIFTNNPNIDGLSVYSRDKFFFGKIARLSTVGKLVTKHNIFSTIVEHATFIKLNKMQNIVFDTELGVGSPTYCWSDEGPDLVLRLINQGSCFLYVPNIVIYHSNPIKQYDEKTLIRSYRYGMGRGKYLKKNNYPIWFVGYVWSLYCAGIMLGLVQLNAGKMQYYWNGLKGRIKGYLYTHREND